MNRKQLKKILDKSVVNYGGFGSHDEMLEGILNDADMLASIKKDSGVSFNIEKIIKEGEAKRKI